MTTDDKEETTPRGQVAGGIMMIAGALAIVGALASSFSRPPSTTVHGAILYLGMLFVIVGLVMYAASLVMTNHDRAIERGQLETAAAVGKLADQVKAMRSKVDELWERFGDMEADLASFRLWQMQAQPEPPAKMNGSGRPSILRALPTQPD